MIFLWNESTTIVCNHSVNRLNFCFLITGVIHPRSLPYYREFRKRSQHNNKPLQLRHQISFCFYLFNIFCRHIFINIWEMFLSILLYKIVFSLLLPPPSSSPSLSSKTNAILEEFFFLFLWLFKQSSFQWQTYKIQ